MNSAANIKTNVRVLERHYQRALHRYLTQKTAVNPRLAVRLGRQAVALNLETLNLALIHENALLAEALPTHSAAERRCLIRRAGAFFAAAILPMEETHRTALVANVNLGRLNQELSRRTRDLASPNRKLKREIARHKVTEKSLRTSERQSVRLLGQSQGQQEQLRHMSRQILSAQEDERRRISRELHDVVAQVLTSINVRLATLKKEAASNTQGLTRNIARTQRLVEKSVNIVHRFAYDLRPAALDYLGLIPALHSFLKNFMVETGIRARLTAFAKVEELNNNTRTVLFRVVQEALTNVARHANASRVDVSIQKLFGVACMNISDDGKAFDAERVLNAGKTRRMGLLGMRERVEMVGGQLRVESAPGKGTTILVQVPFRGKSRKHVRL